MEILRKAHLMKIRTPILLVVLLLSACVSSLIMQNRQNLTRLNYGMTKGQVNEIMGTESAGVINVVNNPYRTAMSLGKDGKLIEVYFYVTGRWGVAGGTVTDDLLTPIVFVDGKLVGWGREFWLEFVQKYEIRLKNQ